MYEPSSLSGECASRLVVKINTATNGSGSELDYGGGGRAICPVILDWFCGRRKLNGIGVCCRLGRNFTAIHDRIA